MSADPTPWRRQSSQISGNGLSSPSPGPPPGAPPPPPPPYAAGAIPSTRIPTEMRKEPPAAIQNAMMTKDKKPFTYTPGGLDLNEIRSPRMAKRLSRNAHLEDSCTGAATAPPAAPVQPHQLPPSALAAMQPQIAIAVLPQGAMLPKPQSSPPVNQAPPSVPAPPPPVPVNAAPLSPAVNDGNAPSNNIPVAPPMPNNAPPPPPPMPSSGGPPPPPPLPGNGALPAKQIPSEIGPPAAYMSETMRRNQPRPDYIADIANHAHTLKRVNHHPRSNAELQRENFPPVQLRQTGFHHSRSKSNDETSPQLDETDNNEQSGYKSPSPPKTLPNGASPSPMEQPVSQVKSPSPPSQVAPRPNFQQPAQQQAPRPTQQTATPSPTVANQTRPFRPQFSPVTPPTPEVQRQKYSPPRTSPPREVFMKNQPQAPNTPAPKVIPPNPMNQQRGFPPQTSPAPPDVMGPIYNQTRVSPPREIVTVFQPQVFQDSGTPRQTERFQGKSRPPGLKMPEEKEQCSRSTPPSSAGLRQAPAPWMTTPRSTSKEVPAWASREDSTPVIRSPAPGTIHITARIIPTHMENYQPEPPKQATSNPQGKVHIIPIRIEGRDDVIKPQSSQQNKYDHPDNTQMYQQMMHQQMPPVSNQHVPQMPPVNNHHMPQMSPVNNHHMPQMSPVNNHHMPQMPSVNNQHVPTMQNHSVSQMPMTPNQHMPYIPMAPNQHAPQMPPNQHAPQMPPMGHHQMAMAPQTPRGWSPVSSPPVQSRSFRVLQKITGSDQEAIDENNEKSDGEVVFLVNRVQPKKESSSYNEMMSPPVYTMQPSYPAQFYSMRSPNYDPNADGGSGNYWVWDGNSQTYVPSGTPSNAPCNPTTSTPGNPSTWHWEGDAQPPQDGSYPDYDYWNYPPQNEEEQRQFWEHYGQMCAYLAHLNAAACRYSPYPVPPMPYQSDSEECGYSSNDEMTYYGQMFKQKAQNYWQNSKPQSVSGSTESTPKAVDDTVDEKEDSDSTDTETENLERADENKNSPDGSDASEDESCQSCSEIPHQLSVIYEESEPQSEADRISIQPSDDEDSSATLENESRKTSADNTSSDTESSIVRVRLPLKLKFSQSTDECQVATVIVGDSEMESSPEVRSEDVWSPIPESTSISSPKSTEWTVCKADESDTSTSADVTVTINLNKKKMLSPKIEEFVATTSNSDCATSKENVTATSNSDCVTSEEAAENDSAVDFWKEIKGSSDDEYLSRSSSLDIRQSPQKWGFSASETSVETVKKEYSESESDDSESESSDEEIEVKKVEEKLDQGSYKSFREDQVEDKSQSSDEESDSESSGDNQESRDSESSSNPMKCNSVRRNMDLIIFKNSIDNDKSREGDESDNDDSSEDSDSSYANLSLAMDGQNDQRAEEQLNERSVAESEEDDSGVTSDLSRHISETDTDAECGSELSKMTRYQRAATHSRLFKLLQDECAEDESDDCSAVSKRERLTLPLVGNTSKSNISSDQESSSSGINSPMSPAVNERLVKELVQSLLSRRKGRHFRKLPLEKLYAAAARILQEDMDYDTGSTSDDSNMFLSPCDNPRLDHSPGVQLPNPENYGENYYDYCDYYSSWADAAYYSNPSSYDIVPSKAFKTLQDTTDRDRTRRDFSVPVRCPKLSQSKCVSKTDTAPPET